MLPPLPKKIVFQSVESKLENDQPVFNEIWLEQAEEQDIWMMNQSHHGLDLPKDLWDQVKIVVDKEKRTATFHQLKEGRDIPLKVDCLMCHANGPRAINPTEDSVTSLEKIKIKLWNLKIKSYGTLKQNISKNHQYLENKACIQCHSGGENFWERAKLQKGNFLAIEYLVKNNLMPPWPYKLSEKEKKEILENLK